MAAGAPPSVIDDISSDNQQRENRYKKKRPNNKWRKFKNQRKRDYGY